MRQMMKAGLVLAGVLALNAATAGIAAGKAPPVQPLSLYYGPEPRVLMSAGEQFSAVTNGNNIFVLHNGELKKLCGNGTGEFRGSVLTTNSTTDTFQINEATGALAGNECGSPVPELGASFTYSIGGPAPLGTLSFSTKHLIITTETFEGAHGKAQFAAPKGQKDEVHLAFSGGAACRYTFTKLKGQSNLINGHTFPGVQVMLEGIGSNLKLDVKTSNSACPTGMSLGITFFYSTHDGELIEGRL
jgi:hypothetical protein